MSSMPIIQFLERFLNVTSDRQSLVINNMANIDTPGYRARDVNFRAELERAVGSPEQASMAPVAHKVAGLLKRREHGPGRLAAGRNPDAVPHRCPIHSQRISPSGNGYKRGQRLMSMFSALEISGAAMGAERQRAEVVATNMANAETTRTPSGGPYHRKEVVFSGASNSPFQLLLAGFRRLTGRSAVHVSKVVNDPSPPVMRYEPGHPDADKSGYVAYPAINPIEEMVDLMGAARAYQLNAAAVSATKQMIQGAMDILK